MEIHWNRSTLFYEKTGTGKDKLLFFHGFGQDHSVFRSIITKLSADYTCYSFDLFFHGRSVWTLGQQPIELDDWAAFMAAFFEKEKITTFSVAGYSLGARLALATFDQFADRTSTLILIAPDGLEKNGWYVLATSSKIMRTVFRKMVERPGIFNRLNDGAVRFRLVHPAVSRFAAAQMNTAEKRSKVYLSWVAFRKLFFGFESIIKLIRKNQTKVILYLGKNDRVVKSRYTSILSREIERSTIRVLDTHHHKLIAEIETLLPGDLKFQNEIRR